MNIPNPVSAFILFVAISTGAVLSWAAEPETATDAAGAMTWMEYSAPGDPHRMLARRVGKWKFKSKAWEAPGESPHEGSGVSTSKMILGGRYLMQESSQEIHGHEFKVVSYQGYDNLSGKYEGIWMSSSGTGMSFFEGTADEGGNVIDSTGEIHLHTPGNLAWARTIIQYIDENTWTMEMYLKDENGEEWKRQEMLYTRAE